MLQISAFALAAAGLFLFLNAKSTITILNSDKEELIQTAEALKISEGGKGNPVIDIEPQKPLENPSEIIKAVYSTGWSAGSSKKINYFIDFIKNEGLNALVIDIKDYSGTISYKTDLESVKKYGAEQIKILKPNALIKQLHDEGIYVIARMTMFQDPVLAEARPDLALRSSSTGAVWKDKKGLGWMDPAAKEVWDYNIAIAKDAAARGFDEINFDYIRFASDGNMGDIKYPVWNGKTPKPRIIKSFFEYLRKSLPGIKISADLFGLTTIDYDDLGIGQHLEDAFPYFDAIAPMVYPSHYAKGFNNYQNPALYPYEVVYKSMSEAQKRLENYKNASTTPPSNIPQLRPWLQDFDLGAKYDAAKVRAQINAVAAAASTTPTGWMLWSPNNVYTKGALQ